MASIRDNAALEIDLTIKAMKPSGVYASFAIAIVRFNPLQQLSGTVWVFITISQQV
jgi:hypothetical protein